MEKETKSIGRGSYWDLIAFRALKRKKSLADTPTTFRTESGLGASGYPHIGSFSDSARAFAVKLAAEEQGFSSEYIAYADDLDGLRKIPAGMPESLKNYLGEPVSSIPDSNGCHSSFGDHMSSLLLDALEKCNIEYTPKSATKLYKEGAFTTQISKLLTNSDKAGEIIKDITSQEKYVHIIPFHSICNECGKIYTTRPVLHDEKSTSVMYICENQEIGGNYLEGCGNEGEADYSRGEGKLSWKVEFAARWDLLKIDFEAYGKDIHDSVVTNDRICREILGYEPPYHVRYEVFLDKGGKKISKSVGNVFSPQNWLRYGSPQSLLLLTFKRMEGSRSLGVDDIPVYMEDFSDLEDLYFGVRGRKEPNKAKAERLKGLFEYCWLLSPPGKPSIYVPYRLLVNLHRMAPHPGEKEFLQKILTEYGYLSKNNSVSDLPELVTLTKNWASDFVLEDDVERALEISETEKRALMEFIDHLSGAQEPDEIQSIIFSTARSHGLGPKEFFPLLYRILLGVNRGPKLGPYILMMGIEKTIEILTRTLETTQD